MSGHGTPIPMTSKKSAPLTGEAAVPGDKSISHRALIFGALAVGETKVTGLLEGEDVLDTGKAMEALGAEVINHGGGNWSVHGVGVGGLSEPDHVIDCGNSGTGVRLLMGLVGTYDFATTFTGDGSLRKRPMARITDPLALFGTQSYGRSGGRLPLTIVGTANPVPVEYATPMPSAQVKTAVLFAGLNTPGETVVIEKEATRDHTERMLKGFGADITTEVQSDGSRKITLKGQPELKPQEVAVPRDPSSAAFPVCAALIVEGSEIFVPGVSQNPTRNGIYTTLVEMGADITFENPREEGGEPVADLRVKYSKLKGVDVPPERAASMIDEYPVLSVVASFAEGTTRMTGVKELRVKESDRIDAMARGLEACGVSIEETEDSFTVHGCGAGGVKGGAICASHLDHRIAMSFLIAGMASIEPISVDDGTPIATSFPIFEGLMGGLGATIERSA